LREKYEKSRKIVPLMVSQALEMGLFGEKIGEKCDFPLKMGLFWTKMYFCQQQIVFIVVKNGSFLSPEL
jgi:hypothetical protein